ncbi:hypothetical protein WN51_05395 [Melipona quadrifasciata]|uniref:Uncharacterized protein n=1 Tax=Melipona quadrifasciata TaxID=166423 RepID=A0A0N0BDQ5_9HYME|nr:hypothetical protein WN51_05395 [Melipona quadrifasciata]
MSIKPLTNYRKHALQQQSKPIFGIHHAKRDQLLVLNRARNRLGINRFDETTYLGLIRLIARDLSYNAHRRAYAQGRVLPANRRPAEKHDRSNRERRDPADLQPAHARDVGETASQAGSATAQRDVRAEAVDALGERDRFDLAFRVCSNLKELHLSGNELTPAQDAPRDLSSRL